MLQYLVNASMIWLACLLVYEFWLKTERFHQYNRIYLLASIAAGILLPMTNPDTILPANKPIFSQPTAQVYELKRTVFAPSAPEPVAPAQTLQATEYNPGNILLTLYMAGVLAGLLLLAAEVRKLVRMYLKGQKSVYGRLTIIETQKNHGPFSFFNTVFIRSRQDFDQEQWRMMIGHEQEHGRQFHSFDNILLTLLRILFWFHPLPHIYHKRLKLLHEYQADARAVTEPIAYGNFLLEQSLLGGATSLVHSLNYSPIKKRITMLTKTKSSRTRLLKYLAVAPLSLLLIIFCTATSFSKGGDGTDSKVTFKGNEIKFGAQKAYPEQYLRAIRQQKDLFMFTMLPDSVPVKNYTTGITELKKVPSDIIPLALNGQPILGDEWKYKTLDTEAIYTPPVFEGPEQNLDHYLFSKLLPELNQLEDGSYRLQVDDLVIDDKGNVAYFGSTGVRAYRGSGLTKPADQHHIDKLLADILVGTIHFKPAMKDGKAVHVRLHLGRYEIEIKNHRARLFEVKGC